MKRRFAATIAVLAAGFGALAPGFVTPSAAAPTADGKEWRELYQTTGLSWSQVATVCPTDGVTPCNGTVGGRNLTGWVWGTAPQVLDLLDNYAPGLTTANPPVVSGITGFWGAVGFLGDMRWTTYTSLTYFYSEYTAGWTASTDGSGLPIGAGAGYSHALAGSTADGSIGLGSAPDTADQYRGVFLWRTAGADYTPPVVTSTVSGTLGNNGWYRSNVDVTWNVVDAESSITSTNGCEATTIATDTAGQTLTCTATSAGFGGPGSASVAIRRDTVAPTIVCASAPTYSLTQYPATVTATASDALSGLSSSAISQFVDTNTAGARIAYVSTIDNAGNIATQGCPYNVVVPTCKGKAATIIGTSAANTIVGTAGNDVIIGLAGNDNIDGAGGHDTICGGDGFDLVKGGNGNDLIDGGNGDDDLYGGAGADDLDGGANNDSIRGDAGSDRCTSGEIRMSSCSVLY